MESAILREKQIKASSRKKKLQLIEATNPNWQIYIKKLYNWIATRPRGSQSRNNDSYHSPHNTNNYRNRSRHDDN